MQITKTPPAVQGNLVKHPQVTINITAGTFTRGFTLGDGNYSGTVDITEIFSQMTPTERDAVKKFIKRGTRMTANAGVEPDTLLTDENIGDEL